MIRVLIADDDDLVRAGVAMILDQADDICVVGEAANGRQAVAKARELAPDVVLMDIQMPDTDGIEATRLITQQEASAPRVIIVTTFELDRYVFDSLRAGASGFILKRARPQELVDGIRGAALTVGDQAADPGVHRSAAGDRGSG